jgi:hypothetical protein
LNFTSYDDTEDPLNWLTHCEQFFRGQRRLGSDRVWIASYHLTGMAQTWYYALEQDEGMSTWERFKDLCNLRFGPPVLYNRLSKLARLPFYNTVQDYQERFNTLVCHNPNLFPQQKVDLFMGGQPKHICVEVELQAPQDLQTAIHLVRAFEHRVATTLPALAPQAARPP